MLGDAEVAIHLVRRQRLPTKCWVSALSQSVTTCHLSQPLLCALQGRDEAVGFGTATHRLKQFFIVFLGAGLWPNGHELRWCSACDGLIWKGRSVSYE